MQGLEPNCRMDGTSRMARAEEERGRSWRPTRMSGGPEKSAAIQGVQPFCTPSECLVPLAPGEDVDSPHRGASTAETMLARPMPSRQREKKKEDEERCGGCATRIDLERRRMRNGDDKPADTGRRRGRIGR